jgi:hypothetical protein
MMPNGCLETVDVPGSWLVSGLVPWMNCEEVRSTGGVTKTERVGWTRNDDRDLGNTIGHVDFDPRRSINRDPAKEELKLNQICRSVFDHALHLTRACSWMGWRVLIQASGLCDQQLEPGCSSMSKGRPMPKYPGMM